MNKIKTKAVIFDYDGTLTYGNYLNIYKSLYHILGYATDKTSKYYQDYLDFKDYKLSYENWVKINEQDFKNAGLTKNIFESAIENIKLIDELDVVLKTLHQKGIKLYVLSGNFGYAIRKNLGNLTDLFTEISANEIYFNDDGSVSHMVATKFDYEGKPNFIKKVQEELNIEPYEICFVGNGENDKFAYRSGAKTICINPVDADEKNAEKWACVLNNVTSFKKILDCIE